MNSPKEVWLNIGGDGDGEPAWDQVTWSDHSTHPSDLRYLPAEEIEHRWISVEERMPKPGELVVAFYPFLSRPMVVWYGGKPHSWSQSGTVTHWMPLSPLQQKEVQA